MLIAPRSKRISRAADSVLRQVTLDDKGDDIGGAAWRGRGPLLADVLRLHLAHRDDRVEVIKGLAEHELTQVDGWLGGWLGMVPHLAHRGGRVEVINILAAHELTRMPPPSHTHTHPPTGG